MDENGALLLKVGHQKSLAKKRSSPEPKLRNSLTLIDPDLHLKWPSGIQTEVFSV